MIYHYLLTVEFLDITERSDPWFIIYIVTIEHKYDNKNKFFFLLDILYIIDNI